MTEDLGTLISEKLTYDGAICALADILFGGIYLFGGLAALSLFTRYYTIGDYAMSAAFVALSIFLCVVWSGLFRKTTTLKGYYEYERKFKINNGGVKVMRSVWVSDGVLEDAE